MDGWMDGWRLKNIYLHSRLCSDPRGPIEYLTFKVLFWEHVQVREGVDLCMLQLKRVC